MQGQADSSDIGKDHQQCKHMHFLCKKFFWPHNFIGKDRQWWTCGGFSESNGLINILVLNYAHIHDLWRFSPHMHDQSSVSTKVDRSRASEQVVRLRQKTGLVLLQMDNTGQDRHKYYTVLITPINHTYN